MRFDLKKCSRFLLLLVVGGLIAVHGVVMAIQWLGLAPLWLAELTRFIPYYWLLVPCGLAVLLSAALPRVWLLTSSINVLLLLTVTMGWQWNGPEAFDARGTAVRVLTYNVKARNAIHGRSTFSEIEREVRLHDPDIVALQDADGWLIEHSVRVPNSSAPLFGLPHVVALGQHVIASRFPIQNCEPGKIGFRSETHRYLRCQVLLDGKVVQLVTAHFVSPRGALVATRNRLDDGGLAVWQTNVADRLTQARALAADISRLPRPLIVMGDFNTQPHSAILDLLQSTGLRDTFAAAGRGWGYTHGHAFRLGIDLFRIDHVLVSPDIAVLRSNVGGSQASEHNPVIADLMLAP